MELDFVNLTEINFDSFLEKFEYFSSKIVNLLSLNDNFFTEINIVDNEKIHKINREYRGIDRPTDVISFAFNALKVLYITRPSRMPFSSICALIASR